MGVLNKTCSISNTPILDGQKVRIFFLASCRGKYQQQSALFSNTESYFLPNIYSQYKMIGGIGLEAVVDDETSCSFHFDHHSFQAKYILKKIQEQYFMLNKCEEGKNYVSLAEDESFNISKEKLTFEKVLDLINKGDLYLNSIMRKDVVDSVSIMAVHEDVYQMLLDDSQEEYTREDNYVQMTLDYFFKVELKKREKWKNESQTRAESYKKRILDMKKDWSEKETLDLDKNALSFAYAMNKFGQDYETSYALNGNDPYSGMLCLKVEIEDPISEDEIFKKIVEEKFFVKKLDEYNLMLRPTITSGDERDYDQHIKFLGKMEKVVLGIKEKQDEAEDW